MIPYAPLNGVSLSWCSLTERLIKRHDLWLIKAKSVIKEIDFNLQGERGEEKRQAGELCWGHCWHAMICNAGTRGPLWGFTMTPHGASRARTCSKAPCKVPSQSHMANPEFVSQLQDKRNQRLSSHLLLYLTLLITSMDCVTIEKIWGGCQPGGLFHLGCKRKSEMQTTLEAYIWNFEMYRPWEMGAGPPTGTKEPSEKRGILTCSFYHCWESGKPRRFLLKQAFLSHMQTFCRAWQASSSLPGKHFQHTLCPKTLCSPHTHSNPIKVNKR